MFYVELVSLLGEREFGVSYFTILLAWPSVIRIFQAITKMGILGRDHSGLGVAPNSSGECIYEGFKRRHREEGHVRVAAEIGMMHVCYGLNRI